MFGWFSRKKSLPMEEVPKEVEPKKKVIQAKINSLANLDYRSRKGSFRLPKEALPYRLNVPSKIGSLSNLHHKPRKSEVKVFTEKLDFRSKAKSKVAETIHSNPTTPVPQNKRGSIVEMLINSIRQSMTAPKTSVVKNTHQNHQEEHQPKIESVVPKSEEDGMSEKKILNNASGWTVDDIEELIAPKNDKDIDRTDDLTDNTISQVSRESSSIDLNEIETGSPQNNSLAKRWKH